ncbi:GNAT family N-acetyltransferase [Mesorhizobium sp. AR07]|uniref:GNAT family N-acetyltransferase n=1 Tax=Mesorhizobium sp. AR07 TaxID=2865838 RepID=UPI00215FD9BF|nr:GNAT family N-acetyltransferase [Mesorhizobium sp. AR07]UVK43972.1 GNAT family N-acetyltransferase [Mesorhizobium sp. AR07]
MTYAQAMQHLSSLTAKPPHGYSDKELDAFVKLVVSEGEVSHYGLLERIKGARGLVMLYDGKKLVGTAAIKNPEPDYRTAVFAKSKSNADAAAYPVELGYVVVAESHRRHKLGWRLVDAALSFASGSAVFATTRSNNAAMRRILRARGFTANGSPYPSTEHPGQEIHLFLRG